MSLGLARRIAVAVVMAAAGARAGESQPALVTISSVAGRPVATAGEMAVCFDPATMCPAEFRIGESTVMTTDIDYRSPLVFGRWDPWNETAAAADLKPLGIDLVDTTTVRSRLEIGMWRVAFYLQLFPEHLAVRRWLDFEPRGQERQEFSLAASFPAGLFPCDANKGCYLVPGTFPPKERTRSLWEAGNTQEGAWNDISPIIVENGTGWSCLALLDCTQPYSDRGRVLAHERANGLALSYRFEGYGYAHPGRPQRQGDAWLLFCRGTSRDAMRRIHAWHELTGHRPPNKRPDHVKQTILYSTHPKGTAEFGMADNGGFRALTESLPALGALGINTIWLRPVEDRAMYDPGDLYRLQEGVGTEDDHVAFVKAAHADGFSVWRDAVPHGGSISCERSQLHPEWICRNKDGSFAADYWAYDFNWPTWITAFSNYVAWSTRKYDLDGWRIDVPTGSRFPNWNPAIPYARASHSQTQGGIGQMKAIRAAARSVNPSAMTLAEANETWCTSFADIIYDQNLCHWILPLFCRMEPAATVTNLMRWLEWQQLVYPPGTVWMRYPESHDSFLAANVWGRAAANAMMALCAWIDGVPMVANESEDMAFEAYREILRTRRCLPELSGRADYSGIDAPPGVFACRRSDGTNESAVLVNFNPKHVRGQVKVGTSEHPIDLPPYAYRVERLNAHVEAKTAQPQPYRPERVAGPDTLTLELRALDGAPLTNGWHIAREPTAQGVRFRVADFGGLDPEKVRLVVRLPKAEGWFAHAAEGDFQGVFAVRHPNQGRCECWAKQYGFVRWDSGLHPFGFDAAHANVGGYKTQTAWRFSRFGQDVRVEVIDRIGDETGLAISIVGDQKRSFALEMTEIPPEEALAPAGPGTGDDRLAYIAGGWLWDDGSVRVRFRRNGALVGVWKKDEGGPWRKTLESLSVWGRDNVGPVYIGWDGVDSAVWSQENDPYCRMTLTRTDDGAVHLSFRDGRIRNHSKYTMPPHMRVDYRADYVCGFLKGGFAGEVAFTANSPWGQGAGDLGIHGEFPNEKAAESFMTDVQTFGPDVSETRRKGRLVDWLWHRAEGGPLLQRGNECRLRFGSPCAVTRGFNIHLKLNLDDVRDDEDLYEFGAVKLRVRLAGRNPSFAREDRVYGNYLNFSLRDGSCPVVEADLGMPAGRIGIPLGALARPDGIHTCTLQLTSTHWTIRLDERTDDEMPIPKYPIRWPLVCVPRMLSPRVKAAEAPAPLPSGARLLAYDTRSKPIARPIQYWTPDDHNAWVGDVATCTWDGRYHVFYLYDRRHHFSGAGTGRHAFAHLSSADLMKWEEHPFAVPITEWYEAIGTGTPFVWKGKKCLAYGLHTSRLVDDMNTVYCHWGKLPEEKRRGDVFRFADCPGLPIGGTYAESEDGIHFRKSGIYITGDQNPSVYNRPDGRLGMGDGRDLLVSETGDPGWWRKVTKPKRTGGDCPVPFDWNGHLYLLQGFHWFDHSTNGVDFEDWTATGDDIYEGLSVPSVAVWKEGRRLMSGWLSFTDAEASWGGWLVFRELVQYPDGRLGTKWVEEIPPPGHVTIHRVSNLDRPFALRFSNGDPMELEWRLDPKRRRAQFADVRRGQPAPQALTLRERHEKFRPANPRDKTHECHVGNGLPFAIENIRGLDKPFDIRFCRYYDAKSNATLFDVEIAGQRTMVTRRAGRWNSTESNIDNQLKDQNP